MALHNGETDSQPPRADPPANQLTTATTTIQAARDRTQSQGPLTAFNRYTRRVYVDRSVEIRRPTHTMIPMALWNRQFQAERTNEFQPKAKKARKTRVTVSHACSHQSAQPHNTPEQSMEPTVPLSDHSLSPTAASTIPASSRSRNSSNKSHSTHKQRRQPTPQNYRTHSSTTRTQQTRSHAPPTLDDSRFEALLRIQSEEAARSNALMRTLIEQSQFQMQQQERRSEERRTEQKDSLQIEIKKAQNKELAKALIKFDSTMTGEEAPYDQLQHRMKMERYQKEMEELEASNSQSITKMFIESLKGKVNSLYFQAFKDRTPTMDGFMDWFDRAIMAPLDLYKVMYLRLTTGIMKINSREFNRIPMIFDTYMAEEKLYKLSLRFKVGVDIEKQYQLDKNDHARNIFNMLPQPWRKIIKDINHQVPPSTPLGMKREMNKLHKILVYQERDKQHKARIEFEVKNSNVNFSTAADEVKASSRSDDYGANPFVDDATATGPSNVNLAQQDRRGRNPNWSPNRRRDYGNGRRDDYKRNYNGNYNNHSQNANNKRNDYGKTAKKKANPEKRFSEEEMKQLVFRRIHCDNCGFFGHALRGHHWLVKYHMQLLIDNCKKERGKVRIPTSKQQYQMRQQSQAVRIPRNGVQYFKYTVDELRAMDKSSKKPYSSSQRQRSVFNIDGEDMDFESTTDTKSQSSKSQSKMKGYSSMNEASKAKLMDKVVEQLNQGKSITKRH